MRHYEMLERTFTPPSANGSIDHQNLNTWKNTGHVVEEKLDGTRLLLRIDGNGEPKMTTRRISVKNGLPVDRTANFPQFLPNLSTCPDTILDGEVLHPTQPFKVSSGIVSSNPDKAIARQQEMGYLHYVVFDVLMHRGEDLRSRPWAERRRHLNDIVFLLSPGLVDHPIRSIVSRDQDPVLAFEQIVIREGGEGIMLKDPSAPYGSGVYKCKRYGTVSVVVMGYTPGKGKYDDTIGAVVFGVHDDYTGDLIEVGQCSGMDDVLRRAFHESDIGKVIDVRAQEFTGRKLRHPRFDCWRPDVNPEDCTLKKLQMDFAYCRPPCHTSPHSIAPRLSSS